MEYYVGKSCAIEKGSFWDIFMLIVELFSGEKTSRHGHGDKILMTEDKFGQGPRVSQGPLPSHAYIRLLDIIMSVLDLLIFILKF